MVNALKQKNREFSLFVQFMAHRETIGNTSHRIVAQERRSRVRAPSVTLLNFLQIPEKGEAPGLIAGGCGSSRAAVDQPNASSNAVAATSLIPGITCE
jgi:hypothetical protein